MSVKKGFSITALSNYQWPVDVKVPVVNQAGEGVFETHRFTGEFKHLSLTEAAKLFADLESAVEHEKVLAKEQAANPDGELDALTLAQRITRYEIDLYMSIFVGWGDDLTDEHGKPFPKTDEMRRKLLEERMIREAVKEAHRQSQGGEVARLGNFETSPVAGPATGESSTGSNAG